MADVAALIRAIARKHGLTAAQTNALLATARVESGLNPSAVGDNGSSFGLFQYHVGGAGGSTLASAKRFLNPSLAIATEADKFKRENITNGSGAAALQRPADAAGYARKVQAVLGGGAGQLNAPVSGQTLGLGAELPGLPGAAAVDPYSARIASLQTARDNLKSWSGAASPASTAPADDSMARLMASTQGLASARSQFAAANAPVTDPSVDTSTSTPSPSLRTGDGKNEYKDILKLGSQFGLRLDPGNSQTTGGDHAAGSYHYQGRAVDFGDARNSTAQLDALANWAKAHAGQIKELFYNPLGWGIKNGKVVKGLTVAGHDNHLHIAM